jgi:hypothetical protein
MNISVALEAIRNSAARLAEIGSWPAYVGGEESLTSRIPVNGDSNAPGFDAGIAAALGLIPDDKQRLSAILHGAYTPEAVDQVRREAVEMNPDSETTWWLAACSLCREGGIDEAALLAQVEAFRVLAADPVARQAAARAEFAAMTHKFTVVNGVPFVTKDGGLQGAYLAGFSWGVEWKETFGIFFIGTFEKTLGLEDFPFSNRKDEKQRPMSGPVWGSRQYVKASDMAELGAVVTAVRAHLG